MLRALYDGELAELKALATRLAAGGLGADLEAEVRARVEVLGAASRRRHAEGRRGPSLSPEVRRPERAAVDRRYWQLVQAALAEHTHRGGPPVDYPALWEQAGREAAAELAAKDV